MSTAGNLALVRKSSAEAPVLSVGTLTADIMNQGSAIRILEEQGISLLHIDVMDGRIWPKITIGQFFVAGLQTSLLKDVHLLVEEPARQIRSFVQAGADMISFSVESCSDIGAVLDLILTSQNDVDREEPVLCGLSVYPGTSLEIIKPYLDRTDYVTLVSIGPDTGKQNYLTEIPGRIKQLKACKEELVVCIDGAVKKDNIGAVAKMGSDVIVTGSAVFDGGDAAGNLDQMKTSIRESLAT